MTEDPRVEALRAIPLFSALAVEALTFLAERVEVRTVTVGEVLFAQGDPSRSIFAMLDGTVELVRLAGDGEQVVALRAAGAWFGEVGLIGVKRRSVTARVASPGTVLVLPARTLHELYQADVRAYALVVMNLARELARKLDELESRAAHLGAFECGCSGSAGSGREG